LKSSWAEPDVRDEVVDYICYWSDKTGIKETKMIRWIGIHRSKYYDWASRYGKVNEHNAWIPRDFWLADWEKQAIIDYYYDHPLEGYRRLTYMMMDDDVEIILQRGREKFAEGVCWDSGLYIGRERTSLMRGVVKTHVRKYITDYLAANPKPPKRQEKEKIRY